MLKKYFAVIHKEQGDFGVSFPDFPGCITAGKTLQEAKDMALEALSLHVDGMLEDGEPMPTPSDLDKVTAGAEYKDSIHAWFEVPVVIPEKKTVRINATIDAGVMAAIDAKVKELNMSRSEFLTEAARRVL